MPHLIREDAGNRQPGYTMGSEEASILIMLRFTVQFR